MRAYIGYLFSADNDLFFFLSMRFDLFLDCYFSNDRNNIISFKNFQH